MDILEVYKWTAIIAGGIFIFQLVSAIIGFDGTDFDTDNDGEEGGNPLLTFISIRNIVCFLLAFSVTSYFGIKDYKFGQLAPVYGIIAGIALVFFNVYLMKALSSLKHDTSVKEDELLGLDALVVFPILPSMESRGRVKIVIDKKNMTLDAVTDDTEKLLVNTPVTVEQILGNWLLLVRRK